MDDILDSLTPTDLSALHSFPSHIDRFVTLQPSTDEPKAIFIATLAKAFEAAQQGGFIAPDTGQGILTPGFDLAATPRVIHPSLVSQRIRVPTVHVTGQKDDPAMVELSKLMQGLCSPGAMKRFEHAGAHDVPRNRREVDALLYALEWAASAGAW